MYQLDAVGRLAPSSLDVSRAAVRRSAHLAALDSAGRPSRPARSRGRWWAPWAVAVGPRPRAVVRRVTSPRPTQVR